MATRARSYKVRPRSPIQMAMDFGPFEELPSLYHRAKVVFFAKVVVYTVAFALAGRAGGRGDRKLDIGAAADELAGDRRLPRPGRGREDDGKGPGRQSRAHLSHS